MQRYFVENEHLSETSFKIVGEDVKHISKVMRMSEGDQIICINQSTQAALCKISSISIEQIQGEVIEFLQLNTELPVKVTVAQGLPKGDKLDLIVQKGTELGADRFIPFQAARSIVKWDDKKGEKKIERLRKIAKEAAEQSYRMVVPDVISHLSFQQLLKESANYDVKIVAFEETAKAGEIKQLHSTLNNVESGASILVLIGPEGGLTKEEVSQLQKVGFITCGFGPRILRTETAAMYFLAAVSYHFEIMR